MILDNSWKPKHKYSFSKSSHLIEKAFIRYYGLLSENKFGTAYSLHLNFEEADKFKPDSCWSSEKRQDISLVYVSSKTLEELMGDKERIIFAFSEK